LRRCAAIWFVIACLVASTLFLGGCFAQGTSLDNTRNLDLTNIDTIQIEYGIDNISFSESPSDKMVVKEYFSADNASYYANTTTDGTTLLVSSGYRPSSDSFSSHVEILLPSSYRKALTIQTVSGMITIDSAYRLGSLVAKSQSGAIKIDNVVAETIALSTVSGRITANGCAGMFECSSSSGTITGDDLKGGGDFSNASGKIDVAFDSVKGNIEATSSSGKIAIEIPKDLGYSLDIKTISGFLSTPLPASDIEKGTTTKSQTDENGNVETVQLNTLSGKSGVYQRSYISLESSTGAISLSYP
jgi:hypothetical protein